MKITFYQQSITSENKTEQSTARMDKIQVQRQTVQTSGVAASFESGTNSMFGRRVEKGKSLIEIQQDAGNMDVGISQDYMTLMSNTMSGKDYAKLQEEGFDFGSMEPEEAVTIVDKIKAELVRSGKQIAGYTDDLDLDTLTAALGSVTLANAVAESFIDADLPVTENTADTVGKAWNLVSQLKPLEDGAINYLIDNGLQPEFWNLYLAENSGATRGVSAVGAYSAENVDGYFAQNSKESSWEGMQEQMDALLQQSGYELNEETREAATWLVERGLPLTTESMELLKDLRNISLPITEKEFAKAVAEAVAEGKEPIYGIPGRTQESVYEKAVRIDTYYHSKEIEIQFDGNISARLQLEEIRLRMTAEVNVKLIRSDFAIDTAPMEELIDTLREAEKSLAEQYFPKSSEPVAQYELYNRVQTVAEELPALPAAILGLAASNKLPETVEAFHQEGSRLKDSFVRAEESYEALMTAPRRDLGDSIKKAFANVDDILRDMNQELTEENRRVVRILGYNQMTISPENMEAVATADRQVQHVVEKMTPAATLQMIRDGVNPLEKSFAELEQYFESGEQTYEQEAESYSRFLHRLDRNGDITPEERDSYIGVFRLLHQIEKSDGAAVGALVNAQAEVHFANLLSAVRSNRARNYDKTADDTIAKGLEYVKRGESIPEQIGKAFQKIANELLTDVSYDKNAENAEQEYNQEQLKQYREAVLTVEKDCVGMLQRGELPASAENLMAAKALMENPESLFSQKGKNKSEETAKATAESLLEKMDTPEEFDASYKADLQNALQNVEEATFVDALNDIDVREMKLLHKQLSIASVLSNTQEYFIPMYVGEQLTKVHLTINQGGNRSGVVEIAVKYNETENIKAEFSFANGRLNGKVETDYKNEVTEIDKIADIFIKDAEANWEIGDIRTRMFGGNGLRETGTDADVDNTELYRVAKVFLNAVRKKEVSYEN